MTEKNTIQVALVTGASRGIGASIAVELAKNNMLVIGTATSDKGVKAIEENFKLNDQKGIGLVLDVNDNKSIESLISHVEENYGNISILVNNAGINGFENRQDLLDERVKINNLQNKEISEKGKITSHFDVTVNMSDKEWHEMISIHLNGTFFCTREALKIMNNQEMGCIINMGSVLGTTGGPSSPHYSAAKAAILGYTRATARELASRNIRVNAIAPGYIDTDMTSGLGDVKDIVKSATPMKRFGDTADIAWAAVYLASQEAKFITGQTISPNGGFVMSQ